MQLMDGALIIVAAQACFYGARQPRPCVRVVATYVVGVASRVCGHPADDLASSLSPWLSLPSGYGVKAFLPPGRSAAQDAVSAECTLLGGVCVCDLSAPRGAEADALAGMA